MMHGARDVMATPPSGTVTFLFTDIEGSTRRWDEQPDAMRHALARHDALLRESIEGHGGCVFKTVGDAFHAAFATAPEALRAAWTASGRSRMRAGMPRCAWRCTRVQRTSATATISGRR
jgi:class 3 adenylate cyclase